MALPNLVLQLTLILFGSGTWAYRIRVPDRQLYSVAIYLRQTSPVVLVSILGLTIIVLIWVISRLW